MTGTLPDPAPSGKQMLSEQVYAHLRNAIMRGDHTPGDALKPQDLAKERGVSLAVTREALVRLIYGRLRVEHTPETVQAEPALLDRLRSALPGV